MPTHIALLRGINVSGHNLIKMEALRASFEALGFRNVQTYGQSGNIVFEIPGEASSNLSGKIGRRILRDFGFSVPLFLKTAQEIEMIVAGNPFLKDRAIDPAKLHVTFLSVVPPQNVSELIQPLAARGEQFQIADREIYLHCPNGYGNTKLSNTAIEKKLSTGATTRNWKTVCTLLALTK